MSFEFNREDGKWLAECLELGTATYAETLDAARAELLEGVSLHLNQVEQMGFMNEFLQEHGVKRISIAPPEGAGRPETTVWSIPTVAPV